VRPGIAETCDEKDNDCDGGTDEGVTTTFYADDDGDGFGDPEQAVAACTAPGGHVTTSGDCDDTNPSTHPSAAELCNGIDDDCNLLVDDGIAAPGTAPALTAMRSGATASLDWPLLAEATAYDLIAGSLDALRSSGGHLTAAMVRCVLDDVSGPPGADAAPESSWYLLRAINCAGEGTYDSGGAGQQGGRDAEIAAAPLACP
jgi:hypothetical protein